MNVPSPVLLVPQTPLQEQQLTSSKPRNQREKSGLLSIWFELKIEEMVKNG